MWFKIGGGLLVLAVIGLAVWLYGGARYKQGKADERTAWQAKVIEAEKGKLVAYQAGVRSVINADARYIETIREKVVPVTRTIVERAADYAATPDGASMCLPADRVLWLEQTTGPLFDAPAPAAPGGVAASLLADPVGAER